MEGVQTTIYKPSKTQQAYAILEKSIQQADGCLLPPDRRTRETGGNGDHRQRPLENLHSKQFGRASRAGRHLRRDAHTYVAREKRAYQGTGLLPLRARHEGREGFGGLRQAGAGGARAVHTRTGAAVEQDLHPCPCGQR